MPLKIEYIRKSGQILGSVTSGYSDGSTTVRDREGRVTGHTSERFKTTRDAAGRLISNTTASTGLLIPRK
jgi:YD repeat-containing protein